MLRIGLTGGIASGKSTAAGFFAELGVPVIDTDELAREALAPGSEALAAVFAAFGPGIRGPDGGLDRRALRARIFAEPADRRRLEAIVHPQVRTLLAARLRELDAPYALVVVPLLVESGLAAEMDRVVVVDCPEEVQIERLAARDGESVGTARRMLAAQSGRERRLAAADDVLENTAGPEDLKRGVTALHRRYLALAQAAARPLPHAGR